VYQAVLVVHIVSGIVGMLLGLIAMLAAKRRGLHTRVGLIYHWCMLIVCVTAAIMAMLAWDRIWWFLPIALFSYGFALFGYLAARKRRKGWLAPHIVGMGSSYIAMSTATLIVNWDRFTGTSGLRSPAAWILPTLVGTPLIARAIARVVKRSDSKSASS
jgi:uncharacterized membrane protein